MGKKKVTQSRKATPWDWKKEEELTPMESFLRTNYLDRYAERHPMLSATGEVELINSIVPKKCPYCQDDKFINYGYDGIGIHKFKCKSCGRKFKPTTGTIFDSRKISISEWIEYCLNICRYVSLNADSWNNRNAYTTSVYWLNKLFLTLEDYQKDIVLSGTIWLDETYYSVIMRDRIKDEHGNFLRGLSRNQICIGVATDKTNTICLVEGFGKPSQSKSYNTFKDHIQKGSKIIHDKENTHKKLVEKLSLKSISYSSKELKGLADSENPLFPVNKIHFLLKVFLNSHSGFDRDDLQNYLNLYAFVINPPSNHLLKVENLLKMVFENPKSLKYRDQFRNK